MYCPKISSLHILYRHLFKTGAPIPSKKRNCKIYFNELLRSDEMKENYYSANVKD